MFGNRKTAGARKRLADSMYQDQPTLADLTSGLVAGGRVAPLPNVAVFFDGGDAVFANRGGGLFCPFSCNLPDADVSAYQTLTDLRSALLVNAMKIAHATQGGDPAAA